MKNRAICLLAIAILCSALSANVEGVVVFDDGGIHSVDYEISDDVVVDLATTVNWLDGGATHQRLDAYADSTVNMFGGFVGYWITAHGNSDITIAGGTLYNYLDIFDDSTVYMSDGELLASIHANGYVTTHNASLFTLAGGSIADDLHVGDNSQAIVSGGDIGEDISVTSDGQVLWSGGTVVGDLKVYHNAELTIAGADFTIDGTPVGYGRYTALDYATGTLMGGPVNNYFQIRDDAAIILIPEPATLLLLGLGSLALLRKCRHG